MPSITSSDEDIDASKKKRKTLIYLVSAIVILSLATTIGLLLHYLHREEALPRTATVSDCHPLPNADKSKCEAKGCIWQKPDDSGPWCTFPDGYGGYQMEGEKIETKLGEKYNIKMQSRNEPVVPDSADVEELEVEIEQLTPDTLRVVYRDRAGKRYTVPEEALKIPVEYIRPTEKPKDTLYEVEIIKDPQFGVRVKRKSTGSIIFDTTVPGFVFSEQYIQITTRLASSHLYGFGEHNHRQLKHDMNWRKWTIFTRDVAPVDEWNLYGAHPMYMNLEDGENANAVLLFNSNAMDVVLQPDPHPAVTYHVIGGILDFYIFLGPTPENTVQQYTAATGRPVFPPYWALGFQLSRWDYHNLSYVEHIVERNIQEGIPLDVQYGDIDYMESKLDFTYDKDLYDGLPEFVDKLHSKGMRYIIILDHCIGSNVTIIEEKLNGKYLPYSEGKSDNIFIKDPRDPDKCLEGEVWPGIVHYPDFTHVNATAWWKKQCDDFYSGPDWGIQYDALWVDMNEPSNFQHGSTTGCEDNKLNKPPYTPNVLGGDKYGLYEKTICMDADQGWGKHYDVHSLYGHSMAKVTWDVLREQFPTKRPLVLTRSQFTGTQKYAVHWLGDNQSQWRQIPWSIVGMLEYSIFGFSYTGSDICGFWYATTEEMCQRWMQLGAFYPYARNHNAQGWPDQDPAAFSQEMIRVSRDILITRYKLLPYLYTLLEEAHHHGSTVVRPLFHEFTSDNKTWSIDHQFLWGSSFMISPALEEGQTVVEAYIPQGRWYDYYGGGEVQNTGSWMNFSTPLDKINLHVRGGFIIPYQEPANTTVESRKNDMGIIVALSEPPSYYARGRLFLDDGETNEEDPNYKSTVVTFTCEQSANIFTLSIMSTTENRDSNNAKCAVIEIWGLPSKPSDVKSGTTPIDDTDIDYDPTTKAVSMDVSLSLLADSTHTITWKIIN